MENSVVKSNFFFSYIDNGTKLPKKKFSIWTKLIVYFLIISLIVTAFVVVGFQTSPRGLQVFSNRMKEIFTFSNSLKIYENMSLIDLSLQFLWITIQSVWIGTSFGFLLAFVTSTISNPKLVNMGIINNLIKSIIAVLRSFPTIIFIYLFTTIFSKNLALVLVLSWFSWIWLHKYMIEFYLNLNYYSYRNLIMQGFSKTNAFLKAIIPQINNKFISLFLYSFDSNMRWSSILGTLSLPGIGQLIYEASNDSYQSMGIPVVVMMLFMILLEVFIFLFNRYLIVHKSFIFNKTIHEFNKYINYKKYLKLFILLVLIILLVYSLCSLDWSHISGDGNQFMQSLFNPNWNILNEAINFNLSFDIVKLISQVIVIMALVLVFSLILIFISCFKLFKYYAIFGIVISTIIRSIPMMAMFFVLNPIFNDPTSSICIILAITTSTIVNKNITESINKFDSSIINSYYMQGYSKLFIFFKYLLPSIKADYVSFFLFEEESQFRDLVTYGKFGTSAIGWNMDLYFQGTKKQWNNMAAFMWTTFFIVLLVIVINYLIRYFLIENRNIFKEILDQKWYQKMLKIKPKFVRN